MLYLYGNYGGDVLNFDLAADMAELEDIETRPSWSPTTSPRRRRSARPTAAASPASFFAYKCAGAAAERGDSLDGGRRARAGTPSTTPASMGVGLSPTILPAAGKPTFELADGEMEIGIGIHGEPGSRRGPLETADAVADRPARRDRDDLGLGAGDRVAVLVNGLGATPLEELYILYRRVHDAARRSGRRDAPALRRRVRHEPRDGRRVGHRHAARRRADRLLDAPAHSPFFRQ